MVEGPQATSLSKWILKKYKHLVLQKVSILKGRYRKHGAPKNFKKFQNSLPLKLKDGLKKGKVIFLFFEKDWTLIIKLGMTAWLEDDPKDANVEFDFGTKKLYYKDVRQFGTLTFTNDPLLVLKELNRIAPDILDSNFNEIQDRMEIDSPIDQVLMNQKLVVSGVGNIIKSEMLYDAKIDPRRKSNQLSMEEWKRLFESGKKISKKVFNNIQSGTEDFYGVIKIYDKDKDPFGNTIENYVAKDGRRTYWVPRVQN